MKAVIISIGEELLTGLTVNTNAAWIAMQLNHAGIEVIETRVVTDNTDDILRTLRSVEQMVPLVLITGGLGPTRDDVTREVLCRYFDASLVLDQQVLDDITRFFAMRGRKITDINRGQALVPDKAEIIRNPYGTAPGFWFKKEGRSVIAMPGVPYEMKEMVNKHIVPALMKKPREQYLVHKTILTHGIGESYLAERIAGWEDNLPENISLAYLPSAGIVKLRITAKGQHEQPLHKAIEEQVKKLLQLVPEYVWGYDNDTLEGVTGQMLKDQGKTVSTAESCTGGYIAHKITSIPGSSAWFAGTIVAYHNRVKQEILNVSPQLIRTHGAVSRKVAEEMAENVKKLLNTDYAIGVTGIAGPDGGSKEKPVGTSWIAIATGSGVNSRKFKFGDNRERNISRTANAALAMLIEQLEHKPGNPPGK